MAPNIDDLRIFAETASLRSPLGRWLASNHDNFKAILQRNRPKWLELVRWFGEQGLMKLPDGFDANDPIVHEPVRRQTIKSAQRTWDRVQRTRKRTNARQRKEDVFRTEQKIPSQPPDVSRTKHESGSVPLSSGGLRMKPVSLKKQ